MKVKIGLAQIDCAVGDVRANCQNIATFARRASDQGCQIVVFPEMSDTGYQPAAIRECSQPWPGTAYDAVAQAAADNSVAIVCGMSERVADAIYNSLAFFDATGNLQSTYRKMHLFSPPPVQEDKLCVPGNELVVTKCGEFTWGLSLCYDLRFPELYRGLMLRGATVLLNGAAWPAGRPTHWDYLTRARAIENQAFFVGVDRVGQDDGLRMHGHSRVVTPMGDILAQGSGDQEELVIADLDMSLVTDFRRRIPALAARRPDHYR